ncbi:hypothetical protein CYMTET_56950 [Cymbomonas tetramitiformis]|uniref:Uncharacterized protein n=1 Tax=Cymbomonas tetramitiformis TaxID=36881 RepID=A0AAE0BB64_9CHLO|nr:hypothetical protein CYMTET_56950 [Cymbomonas tetramitiformis]
MCPSTLSGPVSTTGTLRNFWPPPPPNVAALPVALAFPPGSHISLHSAPTPPPPPLWPTSSSYAQGPTRHGLWRLGSASCSSTRCLTSSTSRLPTGTRARGSIFIGLSPLLEALLVFISMHMSKIFVAQVTALVTQGS